MGIISEKKPVGRYVALVIVAICAGAFFKYRSNAQKKAQLEAESVDNSIKPKGRPTIAPANGDWKPKVARVRLPSYQVVDMTDNGSFLLLTSEYGDSKSQTYNVVSKDGSYQVDRVDTQDALALNAQGNPVTISRSTYWSQRYGYKYWTVSDAYGIRRSMKDGSVIDIEDSNVILKNNGRTRTIFPNASSGKEERKTYSIVEHGDNDSIWIYEAPANAAKRLISKLYRWSQGKTEEIQMPYKGVIVQAIAETGNDVYGTFSSPAENEPVRAYHRLLGNWVELPIPSGYSFSMVKTVTRDGLAIGVVRDNELRSFPVVWSGDQCVMLETFPEWPKFKSGSQIIASARNGNVYVLPKFETTPVDPRFRTTELTRNSYVLNISK